MTKKTIRFLLAGIACCMLLVISSFACETNTCNKDINYLAEMLRCAEDGSPEALKAGADYELQRNRKIADHELTYRETSFFSDYQTGEELVGVIRQEIARASLSEEDVDLLAHIIYAEAGSSWLPDELQLYVGSVVLNRIANSKFPDTLYNVVYQKGQYAPARTGSILREPDERTVVNAKWLAENGSICPINVVWQAEFRQGKSVYWEYYDETLGTTTYICAS